MQNHITRSPLYPSSLSLHTKRLVTYLGNVTYAQNERVLSEIRDLMRKDSAKEILLLVNSCGGPSGSAMSLYDILRFVMRPNLTTIGSGDVDSSGIVLFLAGERRFITPHTTMLLHPAGRRFDAQTRYTAREVAAMAHEDTLKDSLYADIVASRSGGRLGAQEVGRLMEAHTVLSADEIINFGLAEEILR